MRSRTCVGLTSALLAATVLAGAPALADVMVNLEEAASGLTAPLAMVQPAGDERRFVIEQNGQVRIITPDGEGVLRAGLLPGVLPVDGQD